MNRKCPYQAKVMKAFEMRSSTTVSKGSPHLPSTQDAPAPRPTEREGILSLPGPGDEAC